MSHKAAKRKRSKGRRKKTFELTGTDMAKIEWTEFGHSTRDGRFASPRMILPSPTIKVKACD